MTLARSAVAMRLVVGLMLLAGVAPRAVAAPEKTPTFFEVVAAHFDKWDADHDGKLSAAELTKLVADPKVRGPEAAAVAALALIARGFDDAKPVDGFTRDGLAALANRPSKRKGDPPFAALYAYCIEHLATMGDHRLFPEAGPSLSGYHQGPIADCFVLAPLGALVARDPDAVRRMVRRLPNGYLVQFPARALGNVRVPAFETVPLPTDTQRLMSANSSGHGVWINVFEAAVAAYRGRSIRTGNPKPSDIDGIAHAGSTAQTMTALTGHQVRTFSIRDDAKPAPTGAAATRIASQLDKLLRETINGHRLICASTTPKQTTPGMVPAHAHAIVGYDSATRQVRLWNPHGNKFTPKGPAGLANGYPTEDGFFTMPLADFVANFRSVYTEEAK